MNRSQPVTLLDTTLRDGEQTPEVTFLPQEKLAIARTLLLDVGVDRIEVASACVSDGEQAAAVAIARWAKSHGRLGQVEALGHCDADRSPAWIAQAGLTRMNLLTKGSERMCTVQLALSLEQHVVAARRTVEAAHRRGVEVVGAYLEDWSRGVVESPHYTLRLARALCGMGITSLHLADTLGVLSPRDVKRHVAEMRRAVPDVELFLHAHDDYGLATANCLAALDAGVDGLHVTVNGLGERAGNASLAEVAVVAADHGERPCAVDLGQLYRVSELVARASGRTVARNVPVVGKDVFTQTAGLHADGDAKGDLYRSKLAAERFGRRTAYALGKLSGRASLAIHLDHMGVALSPEEHERLLRRIVELGDRKQFVSAEDLPALVGELATGRAGPSDCPATARARARRLDVGSTGSTSQTNIVAKEDS